MNLMALSLEKSLQAVTGAISNTIAGAAQTRQTIF